MTRLLFFFFFIILFASAKAQSSYTEAIRQGDEAFNKQQYKTAINKYFAAEAFDPAKKNTVKEKVNKVFDAIQAQRKKAEDDKALAQAATEQANKALLEKNAAQAEKKIVTDALNEAKKAKEDEHNALVRSITQLNNIQTMQDSIKKEILMLKGVDTLAKQRLIAILQNSRGSQVAPAETISAIDNKIIVDYVISNEEKFYTAYTRGSHKYIGIYFPLEESGSRAKIEALGLSYDDVLAGTQSLTDDQVNILYEPVINSYILYIIKNLRIKINEIGTNRLAALTDLACEMGIGRVKDLMKNFNGHNWNSVAIEVKKYGGSSVNSRYFRDADILLTGKMPIK
jgi:hypothetical protein